MKNQKLARAIARIAKRMAILACGSASMFGGYQPKEPQIKR